MASKSKKRRRVLGASCILAALIIAGSSFAWFTSKDEVTNRLTASSDYGVSIVETFSPPKSWVPGQTVNKDVYAVNTGSIDAFVEEEVSGLLSYSYEVVVDNFGAEGVTYEELSSASLKAADSKEAGGFLIWNNAGAVNGPVGENFAPTKSGDYIFRRAIDKDSDNGGSDLSSEKYALEGYHYDATTGKYYKIRIVGNELVDDSHGNLVLPTDDEGNFVLGNRTYFTVNADGTLANDPTIEYYTIRQENAKPVSLTYNSAGNYLEATYTTQALSTPSSAWATDATTAENIVKNANVVALHDGRTALIDLGNAQITAINAVQSKAADLDAKAYAFAQAYDAVYGTSPAGSQSAAATAGLEVYNKAVYDAALIPAKPGHTAKGTAVPAGNVLVLTATDIDSDNTLSDTAKTKVKNALTNYTNAESAYDTAKTNLENAIAALHTDAIKNGTAKKSDVEALKKAFDDAADAYYTAATNLKAAYAGIETQIQDSGLISAGDSAISEASLDGIVTKAEKFKSGGAANQYRYDLDALIDAYTSAAGTNETNIANLKTKFNEYKTASGNYADTIDPTGTDNAYAKYATAVNTFDTDKLKSMSTDELTANNFDGTGGLVTAYELPDEVLNDNDAYNSQATRNKVGSTRYSKTAVDTSFTPSLIGSVTTNDWNGSAITDTDYRGTVAELTANRAASDADTTIATYDAAKAYLDALGVTTLTPQQQADAQAAYNAAHPIKIKINLAEGVRSNQTWTQIPVTNNATVAHFYLNNILEPGVTSAQLIDSVELDGENTTPASFKDMTFDLNVALKSAQVTYNEQSQITTDAADTTFTNAHVQSVDQSTKAVTWAKTTAPAAKTYSANVGGSAKTITEVESVNIGGANYKYKFVDATGTYYGNALTEGAEFKKVTDPTTEPLTFTADAPVTLDADATENT